MSVPNDSPNISTNKTERQDQQVLLLSIGDVGDDDGGDDGVSDGDGDGDGDGGGSGGGGYGELWLFDVTGKLRCMNGMAEEEEEEEEEVEEEEEENEEVEEALVLRASEYYWSVIIGNGWP
ncbi:unnamed protein product [Enterobius vermicularis]|uniref:Uncharacterized protein n=1 Tax=Enterobius vermicularis TaxID=51028 RepID=A0A0N4VRM8_ENTVE|nr:unnamed protein product [Enterobius vermicularis]